MNNLIRTVDFSSAITIGRNMTKWIPGIINMGVFYFLGICNEELLDMNDYAILSWLANYVTKSKNGKSRMITATFYSPMEDAKREFFWVHYEELRNQLPNLKISTNKAIAERFKKYCKFMLMEHHTDRNPKGVYSYYRFNPILFELLVSKDESAMMQVPRVYGYASLDSSALKIAEPIEPEEVESKSTEVERTEEEVNFCPPENDGGGKERKERTKDCEVNNCIVNDNSVIDCASIRTMFETAGVVSRCFSDDIMEFLSSEFKKNAMDEKLQTECVRWLVEYARQRCKNASKFAGYFYRAVFKTNLVSQFIEAQAMKKSAEHEKEAKMRICPACNARFGRSFSYCQTCGLSVDDWNDESAVARARKFRSLPADRRKQYEERYGAFREKLITEHGVTYFRLPDVAETERAFMQELDAEFGIV